MAFSNQNIQRARWGQIDEVSFAATSGGQFCTSGACESNLSLFFFKDDTKNKSVHCTSHKQGGTHFQSCKVLFDTPCTIYIYYLQTAWTTKLKIRASNNKIGCTNLVVCTLDHSTTGIFSQ